MTKKHRRRVTGYFKAFLADIRRGRRVKVKRVQRMLGLQIWIGTVFKVARQFLTTTCDILRISGTKPYFYPSKHKELVARAIFDLKFWQRFVASSPKMTFNHVLGQLPKCQHRLASDASTSWGMAGVLFFGTAPEGLEDFQGLF